MSQDHSTQVFIIRHNNLCPARERGLTWSITSLGTGIELFLYTMGSHKLSWKSQVFIIRHIRQIKQGWIQTPLRQLNVCEAKGFLKTTDLPEVILVTIALSASYALEKP